MCGIAGVVSDGARSSREAYVATMLHELRHRGPDDRGIATLGRATLGHHRLSILDTTAAGHQPMCSASGRYAIVYNGEVYNFIELRRELALLGHSFHTDTDTEVILAAFEEWEVGSFQRFNGIWAIAIWDRLREALVLSRDRFGVKPLYLTEVSAQVAFASEIKALLALPGVSREPEPGAIRDFLADGTVDHSDNTFFRSVRPVPAAHALVIDRDGRRRLRYWGPPALGEDARSEPEPGDRRLIDAFRQVLSDAVALQLRADVRIGSCLSGGIDSSTIVCLANRLLRDLQASNIEMERVRGESAQDAFFADFRGPGIDERRFVDAVVDKTGIDLHAVTPDAGSIWRDVSTVLQFQDEPFAGSSIVAQYHVMRVAAEAGVTVLLDGQGADELLGGYPPIAGPRYGDLARRGQLRQVIRAIRRRYASPSAVLRYALLGVHVAPRLRALRQPSWLGHVARSARTLWVEPEDLKGTLLSQALWYQASRRGLPSLLRYEDRNSMAFGIEARVPFLDHRVAETALALPDRLRFDRGARKVALIQATAKLVPDSVRHRREKVAFATPQSEWLRASYMHFSPLFTDSEVERAGYVTRGATAKLAEEFLSGKADSGELWRVLILEQWLRDKVIGSSGSRP